MNLVANLGFLVVGCALGGLGGWWLRQRRVGAIAPPLPAPAIATGGDAADWPLAYHRVLHQAQYQAGFLATTSHELRSPINQIISLHQLILEDLCENPEEERLFVQQAFDATQRVLQNLDLLIAVSKLETGRVLPILQPFSLKQVLSKVERILQVQAANRSCRFQVVYPPEEIYGEGDPQWVQQGLMLLLEGAIAAQSSQILVTVPAIEGDRVPIVIQGEGLQPTPLESSACLSATDEPGSPPDRDVLQPLSLPFRWQLVSRLLASLGGKLTGTGAAIDLVAPPGSASSPGTDFRWELILPKASEIPGG